MINSLLSFELYNQLPGVKHIIQKVVVIIRNPYFDNTKAILILLVVLGHTLSAVFTKNHWISSIYIFIYLFHMPAFILIAGYFSRRIQSFKEITKITKKFLIPFVVFQVLYTLYYQHVFGDDMEFTLLTPRWALWFLISMFCWNILLIFFGKYKVGLAASVVVSILIGYIGEVNELLSLSRTFFFFPFFLLGYFLKQKHFHWLKKEWNVKLSAVLFLALFLVVYYFGDIHWREWFYGRIPYEDIKHGSIPFSFIFRLAAYACMALATYCFLSLVPRKQMFFTRIGSLTLTIYLFHMFLLKYIEETELFDWIVKNQFYYLLFLIPVIVVFVLTRKPVIQLGNRIIGIPQWFSREKSYN